jgi:hypothetical protein
MLAAMAASPATAQPQPIRPQPSQQQPIQLILNFDGPQMGEMLTEMGATWERRIGDNGQPFYAVTFRNGANVVLLPSVCGGEQPFTGCTGLRLWANFTKPEALTPATIAQRVNQFNLGHVATMASYTDNGNAQLNMYLISDNGIAIANMRTHFQVFEASAATFSQTIYGQ